VLFFIFSFFTFSVESRNLDVEDKVTFRLVLRQCNQDKLRSFVERVSDVSDIEVFGNHLKPNELRQMLKCDNHEEMKNEIYSWLKGESQGNHLNIICDKSTSMVIEVDAPHLQKLFPDESFHFNEDENRIMLAKRGQNQPKLPFSNLVNHINLILGFGENTVKNQVGKGHMSIFGHIDDENSSEIDGISAISYDNIRR
jgi:hypothetical protein